MLQIHHHKVLPLRVIISKNLEGVRSDSSILLNPTYGSTCPECFILLLKAWSVSL